MRSLILFGSMARRDAEDSSDIDLLLITFEALRRREIEKIIPSYLMPKKGQISLSICSERQFVSAFNEGTLFLVHLFKEGRILYDDGFYRQMSLKPFIPSKRKMEMTLKILKQRLEVADDLRKFNKLFIGVLADFFSISKNLAYTLLALDGKFVFNKKKAFSMLTEKYPNYRDEISQLSKLEPFYLRNVKGVSKPLPFSPNCEEKVVEMRENIRKLLLLGVAEND